ncbi:Vitamin K epoxide reductase complex subunit 1-like protein 1 [Blomia tropicalis]|nr:Vitamin K epoxide reductase complex subunit 1-like protein 1 [Blomia tropicalis]
MAQFKSIDKKLKCAIGAGMILSLYGLYVEVQHDLQPSFEAMCDINPTISCSAAFLSDYGKGFGILPPQLALRNPIFGILFYLTMLVLVLLPPERPLYTQAILALAIIANLSTISSTKVSNPQCISKHVETTRLSKYDSPFHFMSKIVVNLVFTYGERCL